MLKPAPNTAGQWRRFGPMDENGRFGVWITRPSLLPKAVDAASDQADRPHYVVEVNELSPLSCSTIAALPDGRTEANLLTVYPDGTGSRVEVRAVHNVFTWWEAFVIVYLADFMTDYTIATLDDGRGRTPVRAIQLLPLDSLTLWLERMSRQTNGPTL